MIVSVVTVVNVVNVRVFEALFFKHAHYFMLMIGLGIFYDNDCPGVCVI